MHFTRLLVAAVLAAAVLAPVAASADRMWVGFHDDPSCASTPSRQAEMDVARSNNASILRTLVTWADVAPTRPRTPPTRSIPRTSSTISTSSSATRSSATCEVLITLWGTPKWANGDKAPQLPPDVDGRLPELRQGGRLPLLGTDSRATRSCASTGSGTSRTSASSSAPQFNSTGQIVSPAAYAKLAAAGYAGIKAGNPKALVAIGETSSNGRDKKDAGASDSVSPGQVRGARRQGEQEAEVRRLGAAPVSGAR